MLQFAWIYIYFFVYHIFRHYRIWLYIVHVWKKFWSENLHNYPITLFNKYIEEKSKLITHLFVCCKHSFNSGMSNKIDKHLSKGHFAGMQHQNARYDFVCTARCVTGPTIFNNKHSMLKRTAVELRNCRLIL